MHHLQIALTAKAYVQIVQMPHTVSHVLVISSTMAVVCPHPHVQLALTPTQQLSPVLYVLHPAHHARSHPPTVHPAHLLTTTIITLVLLHAHLRCMHLLIIVLTVLVHVSTVLMPLSV
jgi:hypothetical protein